MFRVMTRMLTLIAMLAFPSLGWGQEDNEALKYTADSAVMSGTLNVVLANKNGIVVAADSRRSSSDGSLFQCGQNLQSYCDDSQKLFRTGRRSAMVMAGFAVGGGNSPLHLSVARLLRNRFGAEGLEGPRGEPRPASVWVEAALEDILTGVAALYPNARPQDLIFTAIFAGFDKDGSPLIRQVTFNERWKPTGPLSLPEPEYKIDANEISATKFQTKTAGITYIADAILKGYYSSPDPVIAAYDDRLRKGTRDSMSLQDMSDLVRAILRATKNFAPFKPYVGGEDQIAVLPANGDARLFLPALPTDKQISARFQMWHGFICHEADCKSDRTTSFDDFQHALSEPMGTLFLAGSFTQATVSLDYNYFIADFFDSVTLKWQGGPFFLHGNRFMSPCVLELPENQQLTPEDSKQLESCRLLRKPRVMLDKETVGIPLNWTMSGSPSCFKQNPSGGLTITAGGDCGKVDTATIPIR